MFFCIQTGAPCIMGSPPEEFLESQNLSSKMPEKREAFTPPRRRPTLPSLPCDVCSSSLHAPRDGKLALCEAMASQLDQF